MNVAIFVNIVNPRFRIFREVLLAESELAFVDFQGLDPALERGWRNSKLGRCSGRSRNPASSLTERRFDNLPLASPLNVQNRRRFNPNRPRRSPSGEPQLIN